MSSAARPAAPLAPALERAAAPEREAAPTRAGPSRLQVIAAFAAIYGFWGGTFLATRYAVHVVPPLLTIAVRCTGGAVVLGLWLAARGELVRPTAAQWRTAVVAGALLFLGCHAVMAWAEQRVTSGQAALYSTAIPLWTVALAAARERRRPSARVLGGLALGVAGVAVLAAAGAAGRAAGVVPGRGLALVAGAFCWAAGSLVARDGARVDSAVQGTAMQLAGGAAVLLLASAATGELAAWSPASLTARAAASLGFLVVCGTVLGFGAYTWLMRVRPPAMVGTYAFVNPVVAVVLAWLAGDEAASPRTAVALALVLGAVVLTWEGARPAPARRA
ncbi:drug/metabolite exporter YedA [Gemmatimonadetes bacterium T265]|nr:drug/metabolite exporter YedA [Gemmatimonadetes bacterium T265]